MSAALLFGARYMPLNNIRELSPGARRSGGSGAGRPAQTPLSRRHLKDPARRLCQAMARYV